MSASCSLTRYRLRLTLVLGDPLIVTRGPQLSFAQWNNTIRLAIKNDQEAQAKCEAEHKAYEERQAAIKEAMRQRLKLANDPTERRKIRINPEQTVDSYVFRYGNLPIGPNSPLEMWKVKTSVSSNLAIYREDI
jgi:hypothetical protein